VLNNTDTIAAIATPPGNGGVGIVRVSGALVAEIARQLLAKPLIPRFAQYSAFLGAQGDVIDSGISLYFPSPASYTGEDILELQGHGGAVILDVLLRRVLTLGARLARPGEFTERAFLNDKLDLAQAEAVADLIESSTEQSARSAQKSLQGLFSEQINALVEELTELRIYVEAAIDFVDEEIDFLSDGVVENRLVRLLLSLQDIQKNAQQGRLLREGMTVVLAGKPNAGKSSLLNALAGHDAAIVTPVAGTTRDILRERIQLDGMPLHIIDTAGLWDSEDIVEKEGIRRARAEIQKADKILHLVDGQDLDKPSLLGELPVHIEVITVINKIDLSGRSPALEHTGQGMQIYLSVKTGQGMALLRQCLKQSVGFNEATDTVFIARRRHIEALGKAYGFVESAAQQLRLRAGELVAEDLRQAQNSLGEITGKISSDDLLGKIFSSFCIGK
jgi:tRNA modification GTPase